MLKNIRLFLFDFDGTLVDTSGDILASTNHTRKHYGLKPLTFDKVRIHIGIGQKVLVSGIIADDPAIPLDEAIQVFRAHQDIHLYDLAKFYPSVVDTLKTLENQQKKLGIISNKYSFLVKRILEHLNCPVTFDIILGADNTPIRKPDPAPIHSVCQTLNIPEANTIMVGDSLFDIQAGKAAGSVTAAVLYGFNTRTELAPGTPDFILDSLDLLKNL